MDVRTIVMVCGFVFLAGFVDSIAGGGGLIALPAYFASGIPAHMALGSNKFSSAFGTFASSFRFLKSKKVHLPSAIISTICALAGSAAGAKAVLYVDDQVFKWILIVVIPLVAAFVMLKRDFGKENRVAGIDPKKVLVLSGIIGLSIGFYDGFFGPGTGTFLIFAYTTLLHFDLVTASGNAKMVNLASNLGAMVTFMINGQVNFALAIPAAFFGIAGNVVGSGLALKQGSKIIRPIFMVALLLLLVNIAYQ